MRTRARTHTHTHTVFVVCCSVFFTGLYLDLANTRVCCCCFVCSVSKQYAVIPSQVFELEDGSSSYKDFSMTRNNRFSSAGQASKNIIQPPSAVLHYYNLPPCVSQEQLLRVRPSTTVVLT